MNFKIEIEQEDDGRWIAEISELPGVMAYGATRRGRGGGRGARAARDRRLNGGDKDGFAR